MLHLYGLAKSVGASHADLNHIDNAAGAALQTQAVTRQWADTYTYYKLCVCFNNVPCVWRLFRYSDTEQHIIFKIIYWRAGTQLSICASASTSANDDWKKKKIKTNKKPVSFSEEFPESVRRTIYFNDTFFFAWCWCVYAKRGQLCSRQNNFSKRKHQNTATSLSSAYNVSIVYCVNVCRFNGKHWDS